MVMIKSGLLNAIIEIYLQVKILYNLKIIVKKRIYKDKPLYKFFFNLLKTSFYSSFLLHYDFFGFMYIFVF